MSQDAKYKMHVHVSRIGKECFVIILSIYLLADASELKEAKKKGKY
jgi:hypothetical protein